MFKNIVERGRPQMTIWRMRTPCSIPKATNTYSKYVNTYCSSTAKMVMRTSLDVTLYVYCLSCFPFVVCNIAHRVNYWKVSVSRSEILKIHEDTRLLLSAPHSN